MGNNKIMFGLEASLEHEDTYFMTQTSFQMAIENLVSDGRTYLEAIVEYSEDNDIDFDDVGKLMTTNLKDKLKLVAMEEGYIRQESTLPI
jgi:hypothetical protein